MVMNFLKKTRKPYAAYQDQVGGGSWVTLFTPTRGEREFATSLSVDEIEDLIRAEDARRLASSDQADACRPRWNRRTRHPIFIH